MCQEFSTVSHKNVDPYYGPHSQTLWTDLQLPEEVIMLGLSWTFRGSLQRRDGQRRRERGGIGRGMTQKWQDGRDGWEDVEKMEEKTFPHQQVASLYQYLQYHPEVWIPRHYRSAKPFFVQEAFEFLHLRLLFIIVYLCRQTKDGVCKCLLQLRSRGCWKHKAAFRFEVSKH